MRIPAVTAGLAAALLLGACGRQAPRGAEAAAQAADQPRPVLAASLPQAAPVPPAQAFVGDIAAGDAFEIAAAQTAQQRARNAAVRAFADMMVHDHTESASQLKTAVGESGQTLTVAAAPSAQQQAQLAELARSDPKAFDKAYMDGQVAAHQAALASLQTYAENGDVPSLKAFASQAASTVQSHLTHAKSLDEQLP